MLAHKKLSEYQPTLTERQRYSRSTNYIVSQIVFRVKPQMKGSEKMASIIERNGSYLIRANCGYDGNGKKIQHSMTWTPSPNMTKRQIEREVEKQASLFDERCRNGIVLDSRMTFEKYVNEVWIGRAEKNLKPTTFRRYKGFLKRILPALGNMRMEKIQPYHLYSYYDNLREVKREDTKYTPNEVAIELSHSLKRTEFADDVKIALGTIDRIRAGNTVSGKTAKKFAEQFGKKIEVLFSAEEQNLADRTILHHHRLISAILQSAVYDMVIMSNPCSRTKAPRVGRTEAKFLDEFQAEQLLNTIYDKADHPYDVIIQLILYTGMRRGEALGLEWEDIDFVNNVITIRHTLQYLPERGVFEEETKNTSSMRSIKVGQDLIDILNDFRDWQDTEREQAGEFWTESGKIFTAKDGRPINPGTVTSWFHNFVETNKLPQISIHGLRHTNASIMISSGVPITTTAKRLGHSTSATTSKIYAHAIASADAAAASAIQAVIPLRRKA